jgi:hypothetical protein
MIFIDALKAVFWSFFGVRKGADYESDLRKLKAHHVIVAGVVSCVLFVLVLFGIVKLITR